MSESSNSRASADSRILAALDLIHEDGGKDRAIGFRALLETVFGMIEMTVAKKISWLDTGALSIVEDFIEEKLSDAKFLSYLKARNSPSATLRRSVENYSVDWLRKHPRLPESPYDDGWKTGLETEEQDDNEWHEQISRTCHLQGLIEQLDTESRVRFKVSCCEAQTLSPEELTFLSDRRGVSAKRIQRELEDRRSKQLEGRAKSERLLDRARTLHLTNETRIGRTMKAIRALDGPEPAPPIEVTPANRAKMLQSTAYLESRQASERSGLLDWLYQRRRSIARRIQGLEEEVARMWPAGADHEETAAILGEIIPTTTIEEKRRRINALTYQLLRLRTRLVRAAEGEVSS